MVNIISGDMNSGKTTSISHIYNKNKIGCGYISIKNMKESNVHSYDVLELSTNKKLKLAYHKNYIEDYFDNYTELGPYIFDKFVFDYIERSIYECIDKNISPIYLDEIGMLEIREDGYFNTLKYILKKDIDVYISVRRDLVEMVVEKFGIEEYEVIICTI